MSISDTYADRRYYRSADRALLGGVCAGIADYFGFNLRVLRFMAVIAFIFAMPVATIAYLAAVFLVPARSSGDSGYRQQGTHRRRSSERHRRTKSCSRRARRKARKEARDHQDAAPSEAAMKVREQCQALDQRIVELEKIITSSSYQLDREIRNL